jgi:probable phosphomutase (TIGR03848 family)
MGTAVAYPRPAVPLLLLVRHAVTPTTGSVLYGRTPGISLSEEGRRQARTLAERLSVLPISAVYASPLERALETARVIAAAAGVRVRTARGLTEGDAGTWTGRRLTQLRRTKAWQTVRDRPSQFAFPGGESFVAYRDRAVRTAARIAARHPDGTVALVSHGDTIRILLSDYAGAPLDRFPRFVVAPASVSAVWVPPDGGSPAILRVNDTGTLEDLGR